MKRTVTLLLLSGLALSAAAQGDYKKPFPHSSGAELLAYCQQSEVVVSQLRCNYYIQGVADLAVQTPLACIPRGMNQTQLMNLAVEYLESVKPATLESNSAASLVLKELQKKFPCPKEKSTKVSAKDAYAEAIRKHLEKEAAAKSAAQ